MLLEKSREGLSRLAAEEGEGDVLFAEGGLDLGEARHHVPKVADGGSEESGKEAEGHVERRLKRKKKMEED